MYFDSFSEFLNMGGHGLYVWLAYGLTAVLIVINFILPIRHKRRMQQEQARKLRRENNLNESKT